MPLFELTLRVYSNELDKKTVDNGGYFLGSLPYPPKGLRQELMLTMHNL